MAKEKEKLNTTIDNAYKELAALLNHPDLETFGQLYLDQLTKVLYSSEYQQRLKDSLMAGGHTRTTILKMITDFEDAFNKSKEMNETQKDFLLKWISVMGNAMLHAADSNFVRVPYELCDTRAKVPTYAHENDSGMDVYAMDDYIIKPGETALIPTGVKMAVPEGYEIQVRPKSGKSLKTKYRVANTPGTVDAGYRDEICVIIENIEAPIQDIAAHVEDDGRLIIDSILYGKNMHINKGDKFAQLVLCPVAHASLFNVKSVSDFGDDRKGGFGSTDNK